MRVKGLRMTHANALIDIIATVKNIYTKENPDLVCNERNENYPFRDITIGAWLERHPSTIKHCLKSRTISKKIIQTFHALLQNTDWVNNNILKHVREEENRLEVTEKINVYLKKMADPITVASQKITLTEISLNLIGKHGKKRTESIKLYLPELALPFAQLFKLLTTKKNKKAIMPPFFNLKNNYFHKKYFPEKQIPFVFFNILYIKLLDEKFIKEEIFSIFQEKEEKTSLRNLIQKFREAMKHFKENVKKTFKDEESLEGKKLFISIENEMKYFSYRLKVKKNPFHHLLLPP